MSHMLTFGSEEHPVEVEVSDGHSEYYVDGVAGMAVGFPVSKLILTSKNPYSLQEEKESRKAVCTLIVPTEALFDIAQLAIDAIVANEGFLGDASEKHAQALSQKIKSCLGDSNE